VKNNQMTPNPTKNPFVIALEQVGKK